MLQAELRVMGGKQQGKLIPLNVKKFLIGREEDCQLRPNSDMVSRHHCVFTNDDFTIRLRDLGSTNGTFVNGERLQGQIALKDGDEVLIGKLAFQVVIRELAAAPRVAAAQPAEAMQGVGGALDELEDAVTPGAPVLADSDSAVLGHVEQPVSDADTHLVGSPQAGPALEGDTTVITPPPMAHVPHPAALQPLGAAQPGVMPQISAAQLLAAMQQLAASQFAGSDTALGMPALGTAPQPAKPPKVVMAPVVLPPPEETGAPEPNPAAAGANPAAATDAGGVKKPSHAAADIIRMHSQRRPK